MGGDFSFFIDDIILEKAGADEQGRDIMKIAGVATTAAKDTDGEEIDPLGWETDYFETFGLFNYNHQSKLNPSAVIGEPTKTEVRGDGLYVEGFLYPESELARSVYDTIGMLKKSSSSRRMGFSIEGQALERDPLNPKKIRKAKLTGVALTLNPKNPNTLVDIIKGEYAEPLPSYEYIASPTEHTNTNNTLIHLEVDGKIVEIKKDLSIKITPKEVAIDKALSTENGGVTAIESVDRDVKSTPDSRDGEKFLTKGEVYSEIFNYIYPYDLEKANLLYRMIVKLHEKEEGMSKNKDVKITKSEIEKSLDAILNSNLLEKSETAKLVGQPEGENGISITEGTANSVKGTPEGGKPDNVSKSEDELEREFEEDEKFKELKDKMTKAQDELNQYMDSKKTKIEKSEEEGEEEDGEEGDEGEMMKSINTSLDNTNRLMKSLAFAAKGLLEKNNALETQNAELQKSLDTIIDRVESIENTPIPSKTVTATNYRPHPRLEKSVDGTGMRVLDARHNKREILDILDMKAGLDTDQPDMRYAQSMAAFETSNVLDKSIISELKKSEGVEIVGL